MQDIHLELNTNETILFRFGEQYARMLLIFAMVMMYSLSCPLITPFGLYLSEY